MKFEVRKVNRNISNEELLADVKNIASKYELKTMSQDVLHNMENIIRVLL